MFLIAAAAICGCSNEPTAPPARPTAARAFYPLDAGTSRLYRHTRNVRFVADDGSDAQPPLDLDAECLREIVADDTVAGRVYRLEAERFYTPGGVDTVYRWRRFRQDATGLYFAEIPLSWGPGAAAGVDSFTEARRLAYPRTVGATWDLYAGSTASNATLEAVDTVDVPAGRIPAYRVSLVLPSIGPDDWRHFWYSSCGLVRQQFHTEVDAVDAGTGEHVHVVSDDILELRDADPACPRPTEP